MPKLSTKSPSRNTVQARRAKGPSETALSKAIRDALEATGAWVLRVNSGMIQLRHGGWMHLAPKGTPDVLVLAPVKAWLEVKRPGEKLTAEQELTHARLVEAGWHVGVAHSVGEALELVRGWGRYACAS